MGVHNFVIALSTNSRSSSNSSLNSLHSDLRTPSSPPGNVFTPTSPLRTPSEWSEPKTPLREQQPNKQGRDWPKAIINGKKICIHVFRFDSFLFFVRLDALVKSDKTKVTVIGKEETLRDTILQTAKGMDFNRRNSYSDLCMYQKHLHSNQIHY